MNINRDAGWGNGSSPATLPYGYRPTTDMLFPMLMYNGNDATYSVANAVGRLRTTGEIVIGQIFPYASSYTRIIASGVPIF